jgi:hypothetical protein
MRRDDGEILKMFLFELRYLEDGGYRHSPRTPWRIPCVFEDSPTCLNFYDATRPRKQTRIGHAQEIRRTNLRRWRRLENSVCSKSDLGGKL